MFVELDPVVQKVDSEFIQWITQLVDCKQSLILAMAIVGWTKYTCARKISRRRDAKGAPKIRDYRQSQEVWIKHAHSKCKTLIGPFFDTCQQSGNSRQAAVNIHDNIDSVSVYYGWQKDYRVVWTNSEVCSSCRVFDVIFFRWDFWRRRKWPRRLLNP